jgi:phosphatidylglycerophosphate synthase
VAETWALVDARGQGEIRATTRIGGIPLVTRQVRMAARQRWAGAVVQVEDEVAAAEVAAALSSAPAPRGFPVEVVATAPREGRRYVPIDARAVYAADALRQAAERGTAPEPMVVVRTPADAEQARRRLMAALRKTIDADGVIAYYFMRPISRLLSRLLVGTPVTPNQVTLVAMACGVAAAILAARGGQVTTLVAGVLLWAGAAIDCVDGELARLRLQGSKTGEWLDTIADDVSSFGTLLGLGVGLWRDGAGASWLWLGLVGAVVGLATQAKLYLDLHRLGRTIDTAQYPWFFGQPSGGEASARKGLARAFHAVTFLFRRDFFITILAALMIGGARKPALLMLLGGAAIMLVLLIVHLAVTAARRGSATSR